jgi:glucose/arabinose dehydrogenase
MGHDGTGGVPLALTMSMRTKAYFAFNSGVGSTLCAALLTWSINSQAAGPSLVDSNLAVRAVTTNLSQPTSMAFIGTNDILVLEKASGKVQRVVDGVIASTVLDLPVNSGSERGLLGIALHPDFPSNPKVYLYWTETLGGGDSSVLTNTPVVGNRVDRFSWDGVNLSFETNLIRLRSFQADADQPARGNHNSGVLRFGPDRKLYIQIGDEGRRGQMQNLPDGPGPAGNMPDDQFGGPEPDNAHLTGVILRLNDDGTTPTDNPFYVAGALRGGEAGTNLQKVFAYGVRNSFGMAFDPFSGVLWEEQNGDDSFTELNRIQAGQNLGWVQVMGPLSRIGEFKTIETTSNFFGLQQVRWSPTNIADTAEEALARLFMVFEGGDEFAALLTGAEEVPAVTTDASALAQFVVNSDGSLSYELRATGPIQNATASHIHLGARTQNGPVVLFLFGPSPGQNFQAGDLISSGTVHDADVIPRLPGFSGGLSNLVERMRQGRAYANLHTTAHGGGEIRGQVIVTDRAPVSHYHDPEFSWRFEIAPAGLGFISSSALGPQYRGDMITGAAVPNLLGGQLFHFNLTGNRGKIAVSDPRLEDRVADNFLKYDITESESLLFGTGFGIGTDIQTGPNGNLFVVSLSQGAIYEIFRPLPPGKQAHTDKLSEATQSTAE